MKFLKSMMLGMAMVAIFSAANAATVKGADVPFSTNYVLKTYVAALTDGNIAGFDQIFADNATFTVVDENHQTTKPSKEDVINGVKINEGIKQQCTATTSIFKEGKDSTVYEVDLKYADFTKINYITLAGNDSTGWKITDVKTVTQ